MKGDSFQWVLQVTGMKTGMNGEDGGRDLPGWMGIDLGRKAESPG